MRRNEQINIIKTLMNHLDNGTTVDAGGMVRNPVSSYVCPDIAKQEWQTFFRDYPQLLGLSADLPEPGSFLTCNDFGVPILATRDKEGEFHAFFNVCRHRGTIVETEERGKKSQFNCPFHAWGYNHQGALIAVPKEDHFGPVDKSCHGLITLPAVEKYGLLWVHPNPEGSIDLDDLLGTLGAEFESWNFTRLQYGASDTYYTDMNWKLAIDTFGETYHFNTLHRNSLAQGIYGNVQCYDTYKRNHRMALCSKEIDMLRNEPEANWTLHRAAIPVYYLFPNVQLIPGPNGMTLVRVYPEEDNPHKSFSQISFYVDPENSTEESSNMILRLQRFGAIIRDEDYMAAALSHRGAVSGAQEYVTFGRNEPALHHYHNTYRSVLGMEPLEVISN